MHRTKEEWKTEFMRIKSLDISDAKKARLYYDLNRERSEQCIAEFGNEAVGFALNDSLILDLPVKGMGMTYRELCEKKHLDWLTGEPILE